MSKVAEIRARHEQEAAIVRAFKAEPKMVAWHASCHADRAALLDLVERMSSAMTALYESAEDLAGFDYSPKESWDKYNNARAEVDALIEEAKS